MARIGKCRVEGCNGWVVLSTYADWKNGCDAVGFCKICFTEHRLEFCHNKSSNYKIMDDWMTNFEREKAKKRTQ